MRLLDDMLRIFARRRTRDEDPLTTRVWQLGLTQAGVYVDPERALSNATVWACIKYLTDAVGQLPWRVMREMPDGRRERDTRHPVYWLLHNRPNPEMGSMTWRKAMLGTALRWGNAYAEIQFDMRGVPIALWPIHPQRVQGRRDQDGNLLYEVWNPSAASIFLPPSDIFHLRGFGDGAFGYNVMQYAAQSIGWAQATELFGSSFFGEGMNPSGILEVPPNKISPEGLKKLRADLEALHKGPKKAQRVMFGDPGMKWHPITFTPEHAQFIETRQHQIEEICRWFSVPPHKVMHLLRSTFNNIEHQSIEVVVDSVAPWVKLFEEEADYKLFGQNRQGLYTKMDLRGLLRGDFKSQQEGLQIARRNGIINADEWRDLLDMNPLEEDGDKYIVEGNMTTLNRVGEQPAPPAPKTNGATPPEEDEPAPPPRSRRRGRQVAAH